MKKQPERMNFWEYLDSNPDTAMVAIMAAVAMVLAIANIFNS